MNLATVESEQRWKMSNGKIDEKSPVADESEFNFETALQKLEETVSKLEGGQHSLEESLKLFEEGQRLATACQQALEAASLKVERIMDEMGPGPTDVDQAKLI